MMELFPPIRFPLPDDANMTIVMTQVSSTIVMTKKESKQNQASLRQFSLCLNAMNLTNNSMLKYVQNAFSTNWKTQCAFR